MRKNVVCGLIAAIGMMAATEGAYAGVITVNCPMSGAGALAAQFASGGTADAAYDVTGPCNGNFTITQNNITIHGSGGTQTINGSIGVEASNIGLDTLLINGNGVDGVFISGPASAFITSSTIENSADGVTVLGPARVRINSTTVQNNGGVGMHAFNGAFIQSFGSNVVTGNGGVGVLAEQGSNALLSGDSVTGNGGVAVLAEQGSTIRLVGTSVAGPSNNHTILVSQGSSAFIRGSTITADPPFSVNNALAVITAEQSSTVTLAGGNIITNVAAGGAAVLLRGGSTLLENNGTPYGFAAAANIINGGGRVNTQSVIDLGAAPGAVDFTWNGNISVGQFSSFKADGGNVFIFGTLTLDQAANAYFNFTKGSTNDIGLVRCNSTTDHVANPADVLPNVTIGPPPGCALF